LSYDSRKLVSFGFPGYGNVTPDQQDSTILVHLQKSFPGDPGLRADCPEGRSLYGLVVGDRHRRFCPIRVGTLKGDMVPCPDNTESKCLEYPDDPLFRDIVRKFHSDDNLGKACIDDLVIAKGVLAEGLDMEPYR
jgi:hypothetical protein